MNHLRHLMEINTSFIHAHFAKHCGDCLTDTVLGLGSQEFKYLDICSRLGQELSQRLTLELLGKYWINFLKNSSTCTQEHALGLIDFYFPKMIFPFIKE